MSMFHTDSPITGSKDNPDKLNRSAFADHIAEVLLLRPGSGPLVVSLEGPWGYGKTSVINLVEKHYTALDASKRPIVVNFNPWMAGGAENMVQEFLVQFASEIGLHDRGKEARNAAKQLLSYSQVFDVLKFIPGAEPWASIVKGVFAGVGTAAGKLGELKDLNISQKRESVVKALGSMDKAIIVCIDDLDRLPPSEVFQMIRAIKAISDFPRTTFLLAFERSYVENALLQHGIKEAGSYLDKIIQVRLHLPLIHEKDIHALTVSELELLASADPTSFFEEDNIRISEVYHTSIKPLLKTPREVKRVFNRLRFVQQVLIKDVCFTDIFAIEVLAIKAPHVYEHIRQCPWAYHGQAPEDEFGLKTPEEVAEKYKQERLNRLDTVSEEDRPYVKDLISMLFPLISEGFHQGSAEWDYNYVRGRVASPDRLRLALTFGLPSGEIPTELVSRFVGNKDDRKLIIERLRDDDRTERFITLVLRSVRHTQPSDPLHFVLSMANLSAFPIIASTQDKPGDMLESGPIRKVWWVVRAVLERMLPADASAALLDLASNPDYLPLAAYALSYCLHRRKESEETNATKEDWLTDTQLAQLKRRWINSVAVARRRGSVLDTTDNRSVLFTLLAISASKTKALVRLLVKQDESLDRLARTIGQTGQDSIKGQYSHIKEETLEALGGAELIRRSVKRRLQSPVDGVRLRAIYNSILTGEGYYLIDNTKMSAYGNG